MNVQSVRTVILSLLMVLVATQVVGIQSAAAAPNQAAVKSPCTGRAAYRKELLAAGRKWVKAMRRAGLPSSRSTTTYSEEEWLTANGLAAQLHKDLKAINPPEFIRPWHEAQVEKARLVQNFDGFAYAFGLDQAAQKHGGRLVAQVQVVIPKARAQVTRVCPKFDEIAHDWDKLDGRVDAADFKAA